MNHNLFINNNNNRSVFRTEFLAHATAQGIYQSCKVEKEEWRAKNTNLIILQLDTGQASLQDSPYYQFPAGGISHF